MDLIAHAAAGALLGRSVLPESKQRRAAAMLGALVGCSPDLPDAPLLLGGPDAWHSWHQLYTHSLLGVAVVPPLFFVLIRLPSAWRSIRVGTRLMLVYGGWFLHVALDVVARWPVPLLWPLSDARFALHRLSADFSWRIDMLLVTALALSFWDPLLDRSRPISVVTALLLTAWLALGLPT